VTEALAASRQQWGIKEGTEEEEEEVAANEMRTCFVVRSSVSGADGDAQRKRGLR
jgi:hypothetical protein